MLFSLWGCRAIVDRQLEEQYICLHYWTHRPLKIVIQSFKKLYVSFNYIWKSWPLVSDSYLTCHPFQDPPVQSLRRKSGQLHGHHVHGDHRQRTPEPRTSSHARHERLQPWRRRHRPRRTQSRIQLQDRVPRRRPRLHHSPERESVRNGRGK